MSKSKEESLSILNEYRDEISPEDFKNLKKIIGSFAIEDMYLTREDIEESIQVFRGETTHEEIINKHLRDQFSLILQKLDIKNLRGQNPFQLTVISKKLSYRKTTRGLCHHN